MDLGPSIQTHTVHFFFWEVKNLETTIILSLIEISTLRNHHFRISFHKFCLKGKDPSIFIYRYKYIHRYKTVATYNGIFMEYFFWSDYFVKEREGCQVPTYWRELTIPRHFDHLYNRQTNSLLLINGQAYQLYGIGTRWISPVWWSLKLANSIKG